jgi:hypothetical protein
MESKRNNSSSFKRAKNNNSNDEVEDLLIVNPKFSAAPGEEVPTPITKSWKR